MLIEYKIKFEKDGLTITQHIEPSDSEPEVKSDAPSLEENQLGATQEESLAQGVSKARSTDGGGPAGKTSGRGGSGFGEAPLIIIGPFVLCGPNSSSSENEA